MLTIDKLADKDHRNITTIFTTDIRVDEGTYDAGTVRVALTTRHDKWSKRFVTNLHREVLTDSGFVTRRVTMFAAPTADSGVDLATEPAPRFNATKARNLHEFILKSLAEQLHATEGPVAIELRVLLGREVMAA